MRQLSLEGVEVCEEANDRRGCRRRRSKALEDVRNDD